MKFNELKEQIQAGVNVYEIVNFNYVSLVSQQIMVENIKLICLKEDEHGFLKIDFMLKDLFKLLNILVNYSDIEFEGLYDQEFNINSTFAIEIYDFFKKNNLDKFIYVESDCKDFITLLENEIKQDISIHNSISFVLSKNLNTIASKLPDQNSMKDLLGNIPTLLSSLNPTITKKSISKKL